MHTPHVLNAVCLYGSVLRHRRFIRGLWVARIMCQSLRKKEQGVTMTFHP